MNDKREQPVILDLQGRIMPQATKEEQAVLGTFMLMTEYLEDYIDKLTVDMFYNEQHKKIFKAIKEVSQQNKQVDLLTITNQLRKNNDLENIGGAYYLATLTNHTGLTANIEAWIEAIKEAYLRRLIITRSQNQIANAYDITVELEQTIVETNKLVDDINDISAGKNQTEELSEIVEDCLSDLIKRCDNFKNGILNGIPTNLKSLDNILGGLKGGEFGILAGRPSMKKTAQALCMAKVAALNDCNPAFFSLEMPNISLVDRMILANAGIYIDSVRFSNGDLTDDEKNKIALSAAELKQLKIYFDPNSVVSRYYIGASLRRLVRKNGCKIAFIDYLQLTSTERQKGENREQEISGTSRYLKNLAKELNITIIALSQLNRAVESRTANGNKPTLSDLRESGSLEQDPDFVMFMYRPEYYGISTFENGIDTKNKGIIIVAKHRNGKLGEAMFETPISPYDIVDIGYQQQNYTNYYQQIENNNDPF